MDKEANSTGGTKRAPHESSKITTIDGKASVKKNSQSIWTKRNKIIAGALSAVMLAGIGGAVWYQQTNDGQIQEDYVERRAVNQGEGQQHLPEARTISGVGKGKFSTIDPLDGQRKDADIVGIDTTGDPNNAVLAPPEDISKAGWYIRSAPFGVDEGSTVLTSHIDYNDVVGLGTLFASLNPGDRITLTDGDGGQHHYEVSQEVFKLDKEDPEYIKKTMETINKKEGENSLVMITCGGNYNPASPLGYDQNWITVAKPVQSGNGVADISK